MPTRVPSLALLTSLVASAALMGCATKDDEEAVEACIDDRTFFREEVYPKVVQETCMACHTADGVARDSDLVFVTTARPDHLDANLAELADVAKLEREGTSIVLLKPKGELDHGGGAVLEAGTPPMKLLRKFVERVNEPVECEGTGDETDLDAGLELLSPVATLRKASLLMAGRLPTTDETASVRAGGEPALIEVLWTLMDEPAFADVFMERLNDELLTDRYLLGNDAIGIFDDDRFPGVYWYEGSDDSNTMRSRIAEGVAREPLALMAYVMTEGRPWSEVLTADYTVVNDYTALAWGVQGASTPDGDDPAGFRFREARVPGYPHAGILTTPAFLARYPTTPTNRNRHRAWKFFKTFLATDILTFADRPIDPTTSSVHNPTLNDPQCTVCHATMDPVAGAFQNWGDEGVWDPLEEGWYTDMVPPGFGEGDMPSSEKRNALQWLARQTVEDARFPVATVRMMTEAFTGIELLTSLTAGDDPVKQQALELQDAWVGATAEQFVERGLDIRFVVEQVVLSRYFRAAQDDGASEGALLHAGTARLLTPEELDRKIEAVTGYPWRSRYNQSTHLADDYNMLYGGIDSFSLVERLRDPNGVVAAIGLRMANEMACEALPHDAVNAMSQRRLLPFVELSYEPLTDQGFEVPGAKQAILENIQWLHYRLLGEDLALDDPEIEASWNLWYDVWSQGKAAVEADEVDDRLLDHCMATIDPYSGDSLPSDRRLTHDPDFTLRAWVAVTAYLLADWRFLYE